MRIAKEVERWFPVPNDKDKARVKVKHLRPGEIQDIIDDVMVQEIEYQEGKDGEVGKPVIRQKNDRRKDREQTMLGAVVGWEKFYDREGKAMKCTPENVLRAVREIDGFTEFVGECRKQLSEDIEKELAGQKKT
jgi:hypothetical protein